MRRTFVFVQMLFLVVAATLHSAAQTRTSISSAETKLVVAAGATAPRLISLQSVKGNVWNNRSATKLIDQVRIGDKLIPLNWKFNSGASRVELRHVSFIYESSSPHLQLVWEWKARAAHGPVEHTIRIRNLGSEEVWIPLQDSVAFDWALSADQQLSTMYVEKGADTPSKIGTHELPVKNGYSWEGTSSTYAHPFNNQPREIIPWVAVESGGAGWYAGIEFSGRTRLSLQRKDGTLSGAVGLNPDPPPFWTRIQPGQSFETPTVFVGAFTGGYDGAGNILRRWVKEVLGNPATWRDPKYPWMVNNSWGSGMAIDDTLARKMLADSAELGLEMFHIDAGWFRGVGDWYPDPKKFPHGLAPIADEAHRRGLKMGLWVDWTQAGVSTEPGALNVHDPKVRDWLVTDLPSDWKPEEFKGETIDIGDPAARDWARAEVQRIVDSYKLDMLEHDGYLVAQGCIRKDHPHAPPNSSSMTIHQDSGFRFAESSNSTDVSYHATKAYYEIQSNLRAKHPGLLLEVCNDGGRMVDFGSAAHADYFSITDTYDPLSNRRAFFDTSHVLPMAMLESYVEAWPTPKIENFLYMLRSGMMGWITIMQDTNKWSAEQHAAAKKEFQLYKDKLRPLIRDADLYHVSARPDGIHWDGVEYFDHQKRTGVLYAFHGSSENEPTHPFPLRGLRLDRDYRLTFQDNTSPSQVKSGRELTERGIAVHLPLANSSELVFIEEVAQKQQ
ncbi:MAG: alpha-galactosidase [Acidobacteriaceae bacterium]